MEASAGLESQVSAGSTVTVAHTTAAVVGAPLTDLTLSTKAMSEVSVTSQCSYSSTIVHVPQPESGSYQSESTLIQVGKHRWSFSLFSLSVSFRSNCSRGCANGKRTGRSSSCAIAASPQLLHHGSGGGPSGGADQGGAVRTHTERGAGVCGPLQTSHPGEPI